MRGASHIIITAAPIEQIGENGLRITLAVAGFATGDLNVQVEDSQLVIRGHKAEEGERIYLHRGIAARQFQRSFVLADGIEVAGASLENGLLHIDLVRPQVEAKVRKVEIKAGAGAKASTAKTIDVA
ncbi:MAG: Hsp20 family protein [Rhodospirillales bacterium]|nr:Hsp20 family protein [Rhodospirillales bacterium]